MIKYLYFVNFKHIQSELSIYKFISLVISSHTFGSV